MKVTTMIWFNRTAPNPYPILCDGCHSDGRCSIRQGVWKHDAHANEKLADELEEAVDDHPEIDAELRCAARALRGAANRLATHADARSEGEGAYRVFLRDLYERWEDGDLGLHDIGLEVRDFVKAKVGEYGKQPLLGNDSNEKIAELLDRMRGHYWFPAGRYNHLVMREAARRLRLSARYEDEGEG